MAEYKLSYTARQIDEKLTKINSVIDLEPFQPINPAIVNDVFKCAMSYVNNKDNLIFTDNGSGSQFDDDFDINNPLFDCSSMMMAWVQGIPYEYSRYAGLNNNIRHFRYGIKLPPNAYSQDRPNRYYTNELAHYLYDQGYCFVPNSDYSNIAPGDIIFVSFKSRDGDDFHDNAFMKIDHCLLAVGYKDETHLTCLHTSETYTFNWYDVCVKESVYDDTSDNSYNDGIVLVARIPYKNTSSLPIDPIFSDAEGRTTTSTSNGFLKTFTFETPLKKNTTYTAIAQIKNAFTQEMPSYTNYVGLRASYASGASDATIVNWQKNKYPDDDVYYMRFVTGNDPITALKLYVLNNSIAGHVYSQFKLYEGFVFPTLTTED